MKIVFHFIFQLHEYPCNTTHDSILSFNYTNIHAISPMIPFYLSTTRISMQYHPPWVILHRYSCSWKIKWNTIFTNYITLRPRIFLKQRVFLNRECIFCGWTSRFRTQSTWFMMSSLQQLMHFHILLNSCLSMLEIIKLKKSRCWKINRIRRSI